MLEVFSCMNERSHRAIEKILIHSKKSIHYSLAQDDWLQDERTLEANATVMKGLPELVSQLESILENS